MASLFIIEGSDGSGKSTQLELLAKRLRALGYEVETITFPRYEEPSSHFVREYLNGVYGSADEVSPYTCSLFYALDRFASAAMMRASLESGKIVLVDRYVGSNMAHQGTKFQHAEERRGFFIWLDNLEFELLRLPRPAMSFILRMPVAVSQRLMSTPRSRSYTTKSHDIHEADAKHLARTIEVFDDLARLFPRDFSRIDCSRNDEPLPVATIHDILWNKIEPLLPEKPAKKPAQQPAQQASEPATAATVESAPAAAVESLAAAPPFSVPEGLPGALNEQFSAHIARILELHTDIITKLAAHLQSAGATQDAARQEAERIAQAVLPLASRLGGEAPGEAASALQRIITQIPAVPTGELGQYLPGNHDSATRPSVELTECRPRNELDILPDMLYPYSSTSFRNLRVACQDRPYGEKARLFTAYAREDRGPAFSALHYGWDITGPIGTLAHMANGPGSIVCQHLSPRYGYDVPEVIEAAGLADQFEACFDISLGLYSLLQEAGRQSDAQYAVLLGHLARWKYTATGADFAQRLQANTIPTLYQAMHEQIGEVHPLFAATLDPAQSAKPGAAPVATPASGPSSAGTPAPGTASAGTLDTPQK